MEQHQRPRRAGAWVTHHERVIGASAILKTLALPLERELVAQSRVMYPVNQIEESRQTGRLQMSKRVRPVGHSHRSRSEGYK
jgi:hypothetical protein